MTHRRSARRRDQTSIRRARAAPGDESVAACVLPGTELSFAGDVTCLPIGLLAWRERVINHKVAIFRQINKDRVAAHHDALEFPDGQIVPLTFLCEGQQATYRSSVTGRAKDCRRD